jgi:hypothetical protein
MKIIDVYFILLIVTICISCQPSRTIRYTPECEEGIKNYYNNQHIFDNQTINELLELQKCGLLHRPQVFFGRIISQRKDIVVPAILNRFDTETDEEYKGSLILILEAMLGTEHEKELLSSKEAVITKIEEAIQNMQNESRKQYATKSFNKVREFLLSK